jgi:hypothetical protein
MLSDYLRQFFTHKYDISDSLVNISNIFIQNHVYGLIVLLENVCENRVTLSGEYGIVISADKYVDISSEFCRIGTDFGFLQKSQVCNDAIRQFICDCSVGEFKEKCIGEFWRLVFKENRNFEALDTFEDDIYNVMEENGQRLFLKLIDECIMTDDIWKKIESSSEDFRCCDGFDDVDSEKNYKADVETDVKEVVKEAVKEAVVDAVPVVDKKDEVIAVVHNKKHRYMHTRRVHGRRSITPIRRRAGVSKTRRKMLVHML